MSTTIDERVLEMRFDNRQFETNVSSTMSTLDKLKQKLNFTGASRGLENVNAAAKSVNMTGLGTAVETVTAKFSALDIMGVTALANITNSAVNAGKRIVSALTIDPVKTGFQEYETQINATQTILANTKHKGSDINDVNRALEELNKYADLTIYNFTEMTRNIGTFTAAGIDLDTSVNAIQGIANLAAVSGSTSQQASTAMYQLSQALAAGTIRLMDWNSVVNAGMGGEVFQKALRETSEELGTGAEAAIEATGSFRESLREQWLTAEVLTATLKKFTTSGANEYVAEYTSLTLDAVEAAIREGEAAERAAKAQGKQADAIDLAAEALAKKSGKNKQEIYDILDFARTATDAATKVKTFTQLWDVLKESAQSGWSQTWKIIVGDFEEARDFLTPLADALTGFIGRMSDWRNSILEFALDFKKPWDNISEKLGLTDDSLDKIGKVVKGVGNLADKLEYYQDVVNRVWRGEYKNSDTGRFELLEKDGYDHRIVQDLVNEGANYKLTIEDIEESYAKFGVTMETTTKISKGAVDASKETAIAFEDNTESLAKLNDEQLRNAGLTEDEISLYRALEKEADRLDTTVGDLAKKMSETDGRTLLIDGFKNIGTGIMTVVNTIKNAWVEIFNPPGVGELAIKLYGILDSFNEFTKKITLIDEKTGGLSETAQKLQKTFEGVFAAVDIIATVAGGGLKIAFNVLKEILSHFDLNILDVTAAIADAIIGFRDFVDSVIDVGKAVGKIIPIVQNAIEEIKKWFAGLKTSENIPADIISGLVNGLTGGVGMVWDAAVALATNIVNAIKDFLGIHSPSVVMEEIGENTVAGLEKGILGGEESLGAAMRSLGGKVVTNVKDGILNALSSLWTAIKAIGSAIAKGFTKVFDFVTGKDRTLDLSEVINLGPVGEMVAKAGEKIASFFKKVYDLLVDASGNIDWNKIFSGGMLVALVYFLKKIASVVDVLDGVGDLMESAGKALDGLKSALKAKAWELRASALQKVAVALLILAAAVILLASVEDTGKLWNAVGILLALAVILGVLAFALGKISSIDIDLKDKKVTGLQNGLLQIGLVLLALAFAVKMIGDMDPENAKQGFKALAGTTIGLLGFIWALSAITKGAKNISQVGGMMIKLSIAMMLMVGVIKLIDTISLGEAGKAVLFATAFGIFVVAITKVAKSAGNNVSKVGGLALKLSFAMMLMVGVVKLVSLLSYGEMFKGAIFVAGFTAFVWALTKVTKIGKKQEIAKLGGLVMAVSFSLLLMAGVCKIVGMLSYGELIKGALFVGGFMVMLSSLVKILSIGSETQLAKISGTILAMAVAIGIMAAVAVALSFVDIGSLLKGILAVGALAALMTMMVKGLKGANEVKGSVMMMAIAIGIMAAAIVALSMIDDTSKLMAAAGALAIVMGMFALIEKCSGSIGKCIPALIVMTAAVGALAFIIYKLSNGIGNVDAAIKSATAVGILMAAMAVSLKLAGGMGKVNWSAIGALAVMTLIIGLLGIILAGLSGLNINMSLETVLSISVLLLAMAGVTAICAAFGAAATQAIYGVGALIVAVLAIGALIVGLGALVTKVPEIQTFLDNGIPVLQQIGEGIGRFVGGFIGGIGEGLMTSMLDMTDTFGLIVDKLVEISENGKDINVSGFDGVAEFIEVIGAIGLATVGTSIADVFTLGGTSMEKFGTDGVAFFKAMADISDASSGITIDKASMTTVVEAAQQLADLQSSLEPIGGMITWFRGRDDLGTFGKNIGKFIASMKTALGELHGFQFDNQTFDEIVRATATLATLQSSLEPIGGVISWFRGRDDLGTFGKNIGKFIASMKTALGELHGFQFDNQTFDEIIGATARLAELQSTLEPIGGVITWFTGRDDLGKFGKNIATFIDSMKTALATLEGVTLDDVAMSSVVSATKRLSELQETLEPVGGVITWFKGRDDLGKFGENVGLFADAMGKLKTAMGQDGFDEALVGSVVSAGEAILALQEALPTEKWFDGKMDLDDFSGYITDFSEAMSAFGVAAMGIDQAAVSLTVDTAYKIKDLIGALVGLDTSGLTAFTGIGTGGIGADGAASQIATAIVGFSNSVSGIDTATLDISIRSAIKLRDLISSLVGLDVSGVESFKPDVVGTSIGTYYEKIQDTDMDLVSKSISCANLLRSLITSMVGLDSSGVANFKIDPIGTAMKNYSSAVSNMDTHTVSKSVDIAVRLKSFITSLSGIDTKGVDSFKSAIAKLASVNAGGIGEAFSKLTSEMPKSGAAIINGLIRGLESGVASALESVEVLVAKILHAFSNKERDFATTGTTLGEILAKGLSDTSGDVKKAAVTCMSAAVSVLTGYYTNFYNTGRYMVDGFAAGVRNKTWLGENAARELAKAAIRAAKRELDINSPSRVFREIGMGVPEGFALGVEKYSGLVDDSIVEMTDSAVNSVGSTISRLADVINTDIDAQPTIRPILDLTDVRAGASTIGNLFDTNSKVGVMANLGTVGAMMGRYGQNGNDDVVSAIDKLRKDLGNVRGTTNIINGVTYDDGSNIADAVRVIARAAIMERRM